MTRSGHDCGRSDSGALGENRPGHPSPGGTPRVWEEVAAVIAAVGPWLIPDLRSLARRHCGARPAGGGRPVHAATGRSPGGPSPMSTWSCWPGARTAPGGRAMAPGAEVATSAPDPRPLRLAWEQLRLPSLLRRHQVVGAPRAPLHDARALVGALGGHHPRFEFLRPAPLARAVQGAPVPAGHFGGVPPGGGRGLPQPGDRRAAGSLVPGRGRGGGGPPRGRHPALPARRAGRGCRRRGSWPRWTPPGPGPSLSGVRGHARAAQGRPHPGGGVRADRRPAPGCPVGAGRTTADGVPTRSPRPSRRRGWHPESSAPGMCRMESCPPCSVRPPVPSTRHCTKDSGFRPSKRSPVDRR